MGAIWGDPYTIGGKRGMIPPASLSRVYSPPQQGCHGAFGPTPKGGWCDPGTAHALRDEQGIHRPTNRGAPMAPPSIGGGRFVASLLVNLLVSLANVLVII